MILTSKQFLGNQTLTTAFGQISFDAKNRADVDDNLGEKIIEKYPFIMEVAQDVTQPSRGRPKGSLGKPKRGPKKIPKPPRPIGRPKGSTEKPHTPTKPLDLGPPYKRPDEFPVKKLAKKPVIKVSG